MSNAMLRFFLLMGLLPAMAVLCHPAFSQAGQVDANGVTLAYESHGPAEGEAILLVMGLNAQMTMWPDGIIDDLVARGYRVVRFDNRDAGLSTHLDSLGKPDWAAIGAAADAGRPVPLPYSLSDMADDAVALLDALEIDEVHIVGASMGGGIAQLVAIDHPDRVQSLTLFFSDTGNPDMPGPSEELQAMPPPPPPDSDIEDIVEREIEVWRMIGSPDYPTDEQKLRAQIRRDVERSYDPTAMERQAAAVMLAGDRREDLRTLEIPTVIVHGEADKLVPVENGRDLGASIPDADLRIIEGMGHDLPLALEDQFVDAIVDAASRARGGSSG